MAMDEDLVVIALTDRSGRPLEDAVRERLHSILSKAVDSSGKAIANGLLICT